VQTPIGRVHVEDCRASDVRGGAVWGGVSYFPNTAWAI
jgi:hypothetical protein